MNKVLKALKTIGEIKVDDERETFVIKDIDEYKTVEKELKEKEELQKLLEHERDLNNHLITHEVKALEIIKNKNVMMHWLKVSKSLEHYNSALNKFAEELTQEEYDLLKEVLLCPKN